MRSGSLARVTRPREEAGAANGASADVTGRVGTPEMGRATAFGAGGPCRRAGGGEAA